MNVLSTTNQRMPRNLWIIIYFVSCKRKSKSSATIESEDVSLNKLEIRAYRQYEEFTGDRCKVAKELFEISENEKDKHLAQLEIVWLKLLKKENLQKCIEKCEKLLESCLKQCPEIVFLVV